MLTINLSFLVLLHTCLLETAYCVRFTKWTQWNETNVTFGTPMGPEESVPLMMCLLKCQKTLGCVAAQVNEANSKCGLLAYYPPYGTMEATPSAGWTVYYEDLEEVKGARAWQSSTYADCVAERSIDGKFLDEIYCGPSSCVLPWSITMTENSSWVMELKSPGYVKAVLPFFRIDDQLEVWRNTNFTIFVHTSFKDGKNGDNGTLCTTYAGAPITSRIRFTCPQAIYGKAVRIQDFKLPKKLSSPGMVFSEVKVFIL